METQKLCQSSFMAVGYIEGEEVLSVIRLVCTLITISISSLWWSSRLSGKLLLFFTHWLSGLIHLLGEVVLEQMVLNCWLQKGALGFIKALKFLELVGSNTLALTNLAICVNLAVIVHSHRTLSRVRGASSPRLMVVFVLVSAVVAAITVPFGDVWLASGLSVYQNGETPGRQRVLVISYFLVEAVSSVFMIIIVALLLLFRRPELRQVWKLHRRIKIHFALTMIAITANITITAGGVFYVKNSSPVWLVIASWILRDIHIALDTLVLYTALGVSSFDLELEHRQGPSRNVSCIESYAPPTKRSGVSSNSVVGRVPCFTGVQPELHRVQHF